MTCMVLARTVGVRSMQDSTVRAARAVPACELLARKVRARRVQVRKVRARNVRAGRLWASGVRASSVPARSVGEPMAPVMLPAIVLEDIAEAGVLKNP